MYFLVFISLLLVQTYAAPTDLLNATEAIISEDVKVTTPTTTTPLLPTTLANEPLLNDEPDSHSTKEELITVELNGEKTALSPPSIDIIEETPKDVVMEQQKILDAGKLLSEAITAKIVGPVVIFNSKVAAAAGALPPMLAAKGAIIGSAIATPIEIGAVAGSSIASGVTGKLVAIPISVVTGAVAKGVGSIERGRQIWNFNLEHGGEILKDGLIRVGHIILKPIAVVVGAQTALTGAGVGITGAGIKGVGVGIETVGAKMVGTGLAAKALGATLIRSQFVK